MRTNWSPEVITQIRLQKRTYLAEGKGVIPSRVYIGDKWMPDFMEFLALNCIQHQATFEGLKVIRCDEYDTLHVTAEPPK